MQQMKGIIFDFNGVLFWDSELQEQAWRQYARECCGKAFSAEEMIIHMHGRTNQYVLEYLAGRPLTSEEVGQRTEQKETIYRQLCLELGEGFKLSPGAAELLEFLVAHHTPHTIATSSERNNLNFFIQHLALDRWFDLRQIVYDDGSRPGKPAPDGYLQAAANLGLATADCAVVEDSHAGIRAAYAAGTGAIIALGSVERHSELAQLPGVTAVISSLDQLIGEPLFA